VLRLLKVLFIATTSSGDTNSSWHSRHGTRGISNLGSKGCD
jgi:hypothetical protein